MPDMPQYPAGTPGKSRESGDQPLAPHSRRTAYLATAIGIAVVLLFLVLHLTGVLGPGTH